MKAFFRHFSFEFLNGIRNKNLLLLTYLLPLGFYLMMGFVMVEINPMFLEHMIPAMLIFGILSAALLGIPDPLVILVMHRPFFNYAKNGLAFLLRHAFMHEERGANNALRSMDNGQLVKNLFAKIGQWVICRDTGIDLSYGQ